MSNATTDSKAGDSLITMNDYIPPTDLICQLQPDTLQHDHDDDDDDDVDDTDGNANNNKVEDTTMTTTSGSKSSTVVLPHLFVSKHIYYIKQLVSELSQLTSYEGAVTEHLRMSGIYWSITTLHILLPSTSHVNTIMNVVAAEEKKNATDKVTTTNNVVSTSTTMENNDHSVEKTAVPTCDTTTTVVTPSADNQSILDWIWTCYDENTGSFGGNTGQDGHILYTLSALQIIIISTTNIDTTSSSSSSKVPTMDSKLRQHRLQIIQFIRQLQQPDGSFVGDLNHCGEIDTRFTYCAFQSLVLLQAFTNDSIHIPKAVQYVLKCHNKSDGGFGSCIGAESHAGQVFCCIGALAIAQALDQLYPPTSTTITELSNNNFKNDDDNNEPPDDILGWWLCERQVDSGGLNGRPEKQADVCYSWWILSSLSILGKVSWINTNKLANYILKCQDTIDGGIADRPEDMADIFHTFFGIAGLSLLGHLHRADPVINSTTTTSDSTNITIHNRIVFRSIDPIYALPTDVCQQLQLPGQVMVARPKPGSIHIIDERLQHYSTYYYD